MFYQPRECNKVKKNRTCGVLFSKEKVLNICAEKLLSIGVYFRVNLSCYVMMDLNLLRCMYTVGIKSADLKGEFLY